MRLGRSVSSLVLLTAALAAGTCAIPARAMTIHIDTPGCIAGGVPHWDTATNRLYCQGGQALPAGSPTLAVPSCPSGTALGWTAETGAIACLTKAGAIASAMPVVVTLSLPNCMTGVATWNPATHTLTCPPQQPPALVTIYGGDAQAAPVNTPFNKSLVALVQDAGGLPLVGIDVTFSVPATGAAAALAATTAVTDIDGLAITSASANALPGNYAVSATVNGVQAPATFQLANIAQAELPPASLNVDNSVASPYDPLTDGLMVLRYLFGVRGEALTAYAVSPSAQRNDPAAIVAYLDSIRPALDVDNNGSTDALTDGVLILRYMFGLRGAALINSAVGDGANPGTAEAIEAKIVSLMP